MEKAPPRTPSQKLLDKKERQSICKSEVKMAVRWTDIFFLQTICTNFVFLFCLKVFEDGRSYTLCNYRG
ncbi:MAG: hypothetical protein IJW81_05850, partial [Clostridia bacterium]|nr:hypothetical protein [Clostridia bacterium]